MSRSPTRAVIRCLYAPECTNTSTCRGCDGNDPVCDCTGWICDECLRAEALAQDALLGEVEL